jgi:hypothetical protein
MKEDYYTILMRKCLAGVCTAEEDDFLFEWLNQDEKHLATFARLAIQVEAVNDSEIWDIPSSAEEEVSPEELEALLKDFWERTKWC